jgi:hypothetical protein
LKFFTDDNCNTALYILATKSPPRDVYWRVSCWWAIQQH